ncbi:ATP-binding cassette domain-containing protein [Glutamicibacter sp.]|uniref:ATP-binding cassette domain-containing protein n=1 Tax=Glutamicibacter sp. TaxID=1931995 RepID=UPI0028BE6D14|nr:ATP-binding cassette domain-containing protein [Glutamicibacter sp.]
MEVSAITATRVQGKRQRQVLAETGFSLRAGETIAVVGASGSGKTTLAEIMLGLRTPTTGQVRVLGNTWNSPTRGPSAHLRKLVQGVPQDPAASFVPTWSIRRSITLAINRLQALSNLSAVSSSDDLIEQAAQLAHFDLGLLNRRPAQLSGGQAQRAAIARALAVRPSIVVADEPTSALDHATANSVANELLTVSAKAGLGLLLVTHDPDLAQRCTRQIALSPPSQTSSFNTAEYGNH